MKHLYTAPKSELVQLDPLMVSFGESLMISEGTFNGEI